MKGFWYKWVFLLVLSPMAWGASNKDSSSIEKISIESRSANLTIRIGDSLDLKQCDLEKNLEEKAISIKVSVSSCKFEIPKTKEITIKSVSGDIKIEVTNFSEMSNIRVETVSGDVLWQNFCPGKIKIHTVSGDITLKGKSKGDLDLWKNSKYNLSTISGNIKVVGLIYAPTHITTLSSRIGLTIPGDDFVPKQLAPVEYKLSTLSGMVAERVENRTLKETSQGRANKKIYDYGDVIVEETVKKKISIKMETKEESEKMFPISHPSVADFIGYNRVDGFFLGIKPTFGSHIANYAELGIVRAFRRKKWELWLSLQAKVIKRPSIFLMAEAFNTTASYDRWMIDDVENSLAAFFFKEDFRDYFIRKGISIGVGIKPVKNLRFDLKYEDSNIDSTGVNAEWSLFGRGKTFRTNPQFGGGALSCYIATLHWSFPYLDFVLEHMRNARKAQEDYFDVNRTFALLRVEKEFDIHSILGRVIIAESKDTSFPFGFSYGGIGTVPAYHFKIYTGERIALFNLEYGVRIGFLKFLLFYDHGESLKGNRNLANDIGTGIVLSGISLRVARALTANNGNPWKVFFRLEKRF